MTGFLEEVTPGLNLKGMPYLSETGLWAVPEASFLLISSFLSIATGFLLSQRSLHPSHFFRQERIRFPATL